MDFIKGGVLGLGLAFVMVSGGAWASGDERTPPVKHPETVKECGSCHMVFPPQMLPMRSWEKLMGGLKEHFGENAQLPDDKRQAITAYLVQNASDGGGRSWKFTRGVGADEVPLRISETPRWKREHDRPGVRRGVADPKVGSAANCPACHVGAARGDWELN